jgi:hypothetical protein
VVQASSIATVTGERCEIVGVGPVPVTAGQRLACDAAVETVLVDGDEALAVEAAGRTVPGRLRLYLVERCPVVRGARLWSPARVGDPSSGPVGVRWAHHGGQPGSGLRPSPRPDLLPPRQTHRKPPPLAMASPTTPQHLTATGLEGTAADRQPAADPAAADGGSGGGRLERRLSGRRRDACPTQIPASRGLAQSLPDLALV